MNLGRQLIYALVLVVCLPLLLVANVVWFTYSFNQTMTHEMQQKAEMLAESFGILAADTIDNPQGLGVNIHTLIEHETTVREVTVYKFASNNFAVVSSTSPTKELQILNDPLSNTAWTEERAVTNLDLFGSTSERVWSVVAPIRDSSGAKIGLISIKISASDIDQLINKNYLDAYLVVTASIVAVLLLLISYFRYVGLALKYRRLDEINAVKDAFVFDTTSHIRSSLLAIKSDAVKLQETGSGVSEPLMQTAQEIHTQTDDILAVTQNLLDLASLEHGEVQISRQTFDPVGIVQNVCDQFSPLALAKNLKITHLPPRTRAIIEADPERLKQAIANLLGLIVSTIVAGGVTVTYELIDKGLWAITLKSETFEVQQNHPKAQKSAKRLSDQAKLLQSLGLGYMVAQQLIEHMQGHLDVQAMIGGGTIIRMIFPVHEMIDDPGMQNAEPSALVADDKSATPSGAPPPQ